MPRPAELHYHRTTSAAGSGSGSELVASSRDGLPFLWMILFGGRNYWQPDEEVAQRGGAAADRDLLQTPLEVAEARLLNASDALRSCPSTRPFSTAGPVLARRIASFGTRGILRVQAPWAAGTDAARKRLGSLLALTENYVNCADAGRREMLPALAKAIAEYSPFVPHADGEDLARCAAACGVAEPGSEQAALLMAGEPHPGHRRLFLDAVAASGPEDFEGYARAADADRARAARMAAALAAPAMETPSGLLGRIKGLLRKGA